MEGGGTTKTTTTAAATRKVMIVADPTRESAGALQYALSHAILENDKLILLHVENPNSWRNTFNTFLKRPGTGSSSSTAVQACYEGGAAAAAGAGGGVGGGGGGGEVDFLEEMKNACKLSQPKVPVRVKRVEMDGKDKAHIILSQSKLLGVELLIIGQRRSFSTAILGNRRAGGAMRGTKVIDTAEYLIENSLCTCVGVQKKGQNAGYVLNAKNHRNFWLLA